MELESYLAQVDRAYETLRGPALEDRLRELEAQSAAAFGEESREHASLLSELGAFYRGQGRFEESERAFLRAMDLLAEGTADWATAVNNLAGTHRMMKKLDEAEEEFTRAGDCYAATLGRDHVLYAATLNNRSLVCLERGKTDRAADYLRAASEILKGLPEKVDEYASSLCNLGALYDRQGRLDDADSTLREAVALFEGPLGTDTPHYHAALNTLGIVCCHRKDWAGAETAFRRAADAAKALYGEEHREYAAICRHLAMARERREAAR